MCLSAGWIKGGPPKGLRVRATSGVHFAVGKSAADMAASHFVSDGCLRGGAETGACVWSMVFVD